MWGFRVALALASALIPPGHLAAQQLPAVQPGHRVRLTLQPDPRSHRATRIIGTLMRLDADSIAVYDEARLAVVTAAWEAARRLEASRGRRSYAGRGALIGLAAGAGGGIATGLLVCGGGNCSSSGGDWQSLVVGGLGLGGGLAGAGIGTLVGAMLSGERWETVPLGPARPGG